MSILPKFLHPDHKGQKEYRLYKFYDHLSPSPEIITLGTKKGIYTEEILPEYIKEILLKPSCDVNTERDLRLELNKMFPNGEYDHIEITCDRSRLRLFK